MNQADTKSTFFRQSGWMMAANLAAGMCMMFVHPFASQMPSEEYGVFLTMLRVFVVLTIPAAALQTVLAQEAAAAVTADSQRNLSAKIRWVLKWTLIFWVVLAGAAMLFKADFVTTFKAHERTLWATLLLILVALLMPIFQGLLQGVQNFFVFGWSMILNGFGRVACIAASVVFLHSWATGALLGAAVGVAAAAALAAWPVRKLLARQGGDFDARAFLRKMAPLTISAGSTLFLINVDMLMVQSHFPEDLTPFYGAAETLGIAVVTLCVPVAAVMFPKLVRSRATSQSTSALTLAILGTCALAGSAALVCTIFPKLPLQIMFFKKPELVKSYVLIPWFMWAMVPVTMYNVLINNLIAKERYGIVPFAAVLPLAYTVTLFLFVRQTTLPPFEAFTRIIQILMAYSTALMAVAIWFSIRASREDAAAGRSPATAAKPS
jgi:O-antigen/teichoic acid export membrane protein